MTDPKYGFGEAGGTGQQGQDLNLPGGGKKRPNGVDPDHQLPVIPWLDERLSEWACRDLPPRHWVVPEWIPRGQVTGLYGVGGIHKTNLLIQLLLAKSRGLNFLEYVLEAGPVYGLFCEDTREEIVRRATRITKDVWGFTSLDAFPDFHFASLVGVRDKELATFNNGVIQHPSMPALLRLDQKIVEIGATLITLDTLPHFFGGNEVVRREVTQFITQLDAISIARDCGMLFTAHPSARGRQSGSLESGSTGWEGSVRARLGLHDPGPEGGKDDADELTPQIASDRRVLTRIKSNYARAGETIDLVVKNGVFFVAGSPEAPNKPLPRGPERDAACEAKFLELLAAVEEQGSHVNESVHSGRYAPKEFAKRPSHGDFKEAEFTRAMRRLFEAKRIKVTPFGAPSKGQRKIIDVLAQLEVETETAEGPPPESPPSPPTEAEIDVAIAAHIKLDEGKRALERLAAAARLNNMSLGVFDTLVRVALKAAKPTPAGSPATPEIAQNTPDDVTKTKTGPSQ